jgi:peptidoglycan hydrolase-like protein with peptidoglycan-binding domain
MRGLRSLLLRRPRSTDVDGSTASDGQRQVAVVRRNRALAVGLAALVATSVVSWELASRIRSPAEVAARTAPPKPSPILVPVERRVLTSDVVVRGTVAYGTPQGVSLPASPLKKSTGTITTPPQKGAELREGSVALTVSGRPVFVLQGDRPAYRDMGPGTSGDDVRQLEQALSRLGFNPGPIDGVFDSRTGLAVAAWYLKAGWAPMGPSDEQLQALRSVQADWFTAQSELLAAQEGVATAEQELGAARQRAAVRTGAALRGPGAPAGPAADAARARAEQERVALAAAVATKKVALDRAMQAERAARARLEQARSQRPPPSQQEQAELDKTAREASSRVGVARGELAAAQEAAAAAGAPSDASTTGGTTPAEAAAALRDARLEAITAQSDSDKAAASLDFARRKVALLSSRAGPGPEATKLGIQVPVDEVLFFPALPLRVSEAKRGQGEEVVGPVMTVTSSRLVIDSALSQGDAKLVRPGAPVAIRVPDLGVEATGTVTQVATTPGTNGVDPQRFYMEVTSTGINDSLVGASVVQTITVQSTEGEVLTVPVAALSVAADGSTRVEIKRPASPPVSVAVTPGLTAKGLVTVTPVQGSIVPGDLVVVGTEGGRTGGAKDRTSSGRSAGTK